MTSQNTQMNATTAEFFNDLVDLVAREYLSTADFKRIGRLARIVGARLGITSASAIDAAVAEAAV